MCRGRPAQADQGGCHPDLWAGGRHQALQCTERPVGLGRAQRTLLLCNCSTVCIYGVVSRSVVRPRLTVYVCQESQREHQVKHENGDASANTFFGQSMPALTVGKCNIPAAVLEGVVQGLVQGPVQGLVQPGGRVPEWTEDNRIYLQKLLHNLTSSK